MLKIKELKTLTSNEFNGLKQILLEYGKYMYEELQLIAGKDSYRTEMLTFPTEKYHEPDGAFLLALYNDIPVGCIGLRRYDSDSCEMKRMYINPQYRGLKIGETLCY